MPKRSVSKQLKSLKKKFARLERHLSSRVSSTSSGSNSDQDLPDLPPRHSSESDTNLDPIVLETPVPSQSPLPSTRQADAPGPIPTPETFAALLGAKPTTSEISGPAIHEELVVRWTSYLRQGLTPDNRKDLLQKYSIPENCSALKAPQMNNELKAIWSPNLAKNDTFLSSLQDQLGVGLSILGAVLTARLNETSTLTVSLNDADSMQRLADAAQLLCSVHHGLSKKRKFELHRLINDDGKTAAHQTPIDDFLFGKEFMDTVSTCRTVKKAGAALKRPTSTHLPIPARAGPSASLGQSLNFSGPIPPFRRKREQKRGEDALQRRDPPRRRFPNSNSRHRSYKTSHKPTRNHI